nr:hypothetical protein [uncultured Carboxylicivirga sp.]
MKKLILIVALFILVFKGALAQTNSPLWVMIQDSSSLNPVPSAYIVNSTNREVKATNDNGLLKIHVNPNDTLLFKCMGYENKSWIIDNNNSSVDTLVLQVIEKSYTLNEIQVINYRSYAAFCSKIANMPMMKTEEYNIPFKIDLGMSLAIKKAESGTFGVSLGEIVRLIGKIGKHKANSVQASEEELSSIYNKVTSRDNLQALTQLKEASLDSFLLFIRTKYKISPKLSKYDMLVQINDAYDHFLASRSDSSFVDF